MIIIYGTRHFGRTGGHKGQYATTKYFHVYYVPLLPADSTWITREANGQRLGHPVRTSAKRVAAGYATVWGPIAAIAGLSTALSGALLGIPFAIAGAAASVWSLRTRALRTDRDRLRSDFNQLAFGTRCDPLDMTTPMAEAMRDDVEAAWADAAAGKSPEDVARFGADGLRQAVCAYAVLRLAARTTDGPAAARALTASEQLLERHAGASVTELEGGPYRAPPQLPPAT
jgi:hypothetical protein